MLSTYCENEDLSFFHGMVILLCLHAVLTFQLGYGSGINYFLFFFTRSFTTLCYSADGQSILAGGLSKFVCIYNVKEQILMKKFEISCNFSLDAMEVRDQRSQVFHSHTPARLWFWYNISLSGIHECFIKDRFILCRRVIRKYISENKINS